MKVAVPDTLLLLFGSNAMLNFFASVELLFVLHPTTMAITIAIDKIIFHYFEI
jgi:hypothetical protein